VHVQVCDAEEYSRPCSGEETPVIRMARKKQSPLMKVAIFAFLGVVTIVWIINFAVDATNPTYDGTQINNIFMTIAGSGVLIKVLLDKVAADGGGDDQE